MAKKVDLDQSPGHLLRRATQFAQDLFTKEVGPGGLTARQFAVLVTVERDEGLSQTDLVKQTGIDRQPATAHTLPCSTLQTWTQRTRGL